MNNENKPAPKNSKNTPTELPKKPIGNNPANTWDKDSNSVFAYEGDVSTQLK
jgi:hypothetical protein